MRVYKECMPDINGKEYPRNSDNNISITDTPGKC